MFDVVRAKKDCTGCAACMNICPVKSITMICDSEGFVYPTIDDKCMHCKKCVQVCPIFNEHPKISISWKPYTVAARTNNEKLWAESTSGGAFTEICNTFGDEETVVFGAKFENFLVLHDYVIGIDEIMDFRKSKYVQSRIEYSYAYARKFLESGSRVIFSGTPCQIAGLKAFLCRDYEKLLCIDLICHGVGSPKVFLDFISYANNMYDDDIVEYSFRNKFKLAGSLHEQISVYQFRDSDEAFIENDGYNQLFYSQLSLRPSCGNNCRFRSIDRLSDITIGDLNNLEGKYPELEDYRNYSTVIINSEKGDSVFTDLKKKMKVLSYAIDELKRDNPNYYCCTNNNPRRDMFFKEYVAGAGMGFLLKKYTEQDVIRDCSRELSRQ